MKWNQLVLHKQIRIFSSSDELFIIIQSQCVMSVGGIVDIVPLAAIAHFKSIIRRLKYHLGGFPGTKFEVEKLRKCLKR